MLCKVVFLLDKYVRIYTSQHYSYTFKIERLDQITGNNFENLGLLEILTSDKIVFICIDVLYNAITKIINIFFL